MGPVCRTGATLPTPALLPPPPPPPPPPGHGGWHERRPSGGQHARLLLELPPLDRQAPLSSPQHPRMPLVMAAEAVPHPPVPLAGLA